MLCSFLCSLGTTQGRVPSAFRVALLTSVNLAVPSQVYPEIGLLGNSSSVKVDIDCQQLGKFVQCESSWVSRYSHTRPIVHGKTITVPIAVTSVQVVKTLKSIFCLMMPV